MDSYGPPHMAKQTQDDQPELTYVSSYVRTRDVTQKTYQSRYYVHFRANTLGKGMNPLILPPAMNK